MVYQREIQVQTSGHRDIHNLTEDVARIAGESGVRQGVVHIFNLGSTGAIGTIEFEPGLEEDLPGRARDLGQYLRNGLEATLGNHPNVGDIRGVGLFLGVELVADRASKATFRDNSLLAWLTDQMRDRGLILRNDSRNDPTTQLCPPLVITQEECDRVIGILEESITEMGRRLGSTGTVHAAGNAR